MTTSYATQSVADQTSAAYRNVTAKLGLLGFDAAIPDAVREFAGQGVAQMREASDRSMDAFETSVGKFEKSFGAAGVQAAAFNRKIIGMARRNLNSGFDLADSLTRARTLADMVELQSAYWRDQFGTLAAQADEVRTLSMELTATAPTNAQMAQTAYWRREAS